jgi:oxygen-independent coproporphyrinogen-3 oxidase
MQNNLEKLIEKYSLAAPRYTSYPPVPFWQNTPSDEQWINDLRVHYDESIGVDLYIHVPYCEKLCYYCGCNRKITQNHDLEAPFMDLIHNEWDLYVNSLGFIPKINSMHFGGGTPTFLSPKHLRSIINYLSKERTRSFIGSIEIDPRTCSNDHLSVLSDTGISRVSLGIQDFDSQVQSAINRYQPISLVERIVNNIRKMGISAINFDLIYGLPMQSIQSIENTMENVATLRPDSIAFYGYAHLPHKIKNQRLIKESELPSAVLRNQLYETGKRILLQDGYFDIGLDHFALPGNHLYEAKINGKLHRNFMGYVDKKSNVLIGLGPSSISDSSKSFVQNFKDIEDYQNALKLKKLPIEKGHTHTKIDLMVQNIILDLMCQRQVKIDLDQITFQKEVLNDLNNLANDQLIYLKGNSLSLTTLGTIFMRNVAMVFDHHLRSQKSKTIFSQTI